MAGVWQQGASTPKPLGFFTPLKVNKDLKAHLLIYNLSIDIYLLC